MSPLRTKWLWYVLVVVAGPTYSPVRSVAVRTPPKTPAAVEAQAKFFQDFFSVQLSPYKIEFGHVCEDPNTWEQRYEKKDYKNHRDMGKVRWGDKKGGYGEHYWDLNHAGHADKHGHDDDYGPDSDDGYHVHEPDNSDSYDEQSEQSPNYDNNEKSNNYDTNQYDPEKESYEEANRAKRHPKTKADDNEEEYEEVKRIKPRQRKHKSINQPATSRIIVEDVEENEKTLNEEYKKPKRKHRPALKELDFEDDDSIYTNTDTDEFVKATSEKQSQYTPKPQSDPTRYVSYEGGAGVGQYRQPDVTPKPQSEPSRYVSYEAGAGVRQYKPPDVTPAASVPRLFLEPSTGHVIDRTTGQAYILQPIVANNNFNVNQA